MPFRTAALLGGLLLLAGTSPAAPPPSLNIDISHTVLRMYETEGGPATEVELTISNEGRSELYALTLDFALDAPPPPHRAHQSDDRVDVRTLRPGESVTLVWVLTLQAPLMAQQPLFAAVRAVDTATQQPVQDTLMSMGREARP